MVWSWRESCGHRCPYDHHQNERLERKLAKRGAKVKKTRAKLKQLKEKQAA
jgi:hypothetical protein